MALRSSKLQSPPNTSRKRPNAPPAKPPVPFLHLILHIRFRNDLSGPSIPPNFIAPIDKGFKEALATGLLSGSPAEYIRVVLTDGNYHEVDSSEHSFKLAAFGAVQQAYHEAAPKVLEPIMDVEVIAPAEFNAQVLGTISGRRGTVENSVNQGESVVLTAIVPLKDMFGYSGQLRGATQGYTFFFEFISSRCHVIASGVGSVKFEIFARRLN